MDEKLAVSIVREIIRDIYGRYGMEQFFRSIEPRHYRIGGSYPI